MDQRTALYLRDIIFRTNALVDSGSSTTFSQVYEAIDQFRVIEWLDQAGADMSILLSEQMESEKKSISDMLEQVAEPLKGREMRKLGVENNGFCLLIALVVESLSVHEG